ncbi:tRNA pseudouridine(55) synthase TruB [Elstera cyanobacteriorum]|uniref:tRNA pseudouridine(55) synthase TruB n=1 Tax=Elstera cyanobacteriorum TaxID=2022747 RepID=UPI0023572A16|nr:tRNA pseudouridine(55) synthase TruB [Elstera cyanobacteriorum]MCK6441528.1 tRNA pseudouridine(55) synthase TruB [Elstera cyanobacteriorum]
MSRKRRGQPIHGWLVVDKPLGVTSAAVVGKAKRLLNAEKVGHGGTLDPLASGILPLAFGEATKTVSLVMDGRKSYRFTLRWGIARSTEDAEGEITATSEVRPDHAAIDAVLPRFLGTILQQPPAYSALKIDGQRAYDLARAGEAVELAARPVEIFDLRLREMPDADHAVFEVDCGKGTYVRSLGRDIAFALGTVGHLAALRRTKVGVFSEADAILLDSAGESDHSPPLSDRLLPILTVLDDIPALAIPVASAQRLRHGQALPLPASDWGVLADCSPETVLVAIAEGTPVALCHREGENLRPSRVFNL